MKALFRQICFTFFVLCSSSVFAAISPYLQVPTESSIWVSWKTESGNESFVRYGISKTQLNGTASGSTQNLSSRYKYHMVNITGLQPDTLYYQVKTRQEESTVHTFKAAPAPGQSDGVIRFVISGDHQIRGETRYLEMLQKARTKVEQLYGSDVSQHIHMMLNDGDQVDVGTLDHYENLHFAQSVPFATDVPILTVIGNHEYFRDSDLSNYRAHFAYDGLSYRGNSAASDETYYTLQYGRVLVIVLNSMEDNTTQENWLSQVLTAADADNSVDWVVSVVHHPYRAENYVSDVRSQWMERLSVSNKHVLNIAGHHHLYARGQKNDASAYHMISGGTAWDQYWGSGGTERDNKEVQKTIANWSWQLVEFDIANREMRVKAYAEAHPILYKEQGMHYNSREIDSFSTKLDNTAPARPTIVGDFTGAQTLPLTLRSSDYRSNGTEQLNITHFQTSR